MKPSPRKFIGSLAALGAAVLCGAAGAQQAGPGVVEGPTWRLVALQGFETAALPGGTQSVTARFEGGRVTGFSGCNRFFGNYALQGGQLSVGSLAGSMMACEPKAMALEQAVQRALAGGFRPQRDGDRLSLLSAAGAPLLVFQAEPAPALAGLRSTITGFNNGRQAVVSPLPGSTLSLAFGDGVVKGFGGCNTLRASYKAEGSRIAVGPVSTTRRVCTPVGLMQQEREFVAALQSTTRWAFSGALLDMHRPDGERTLTGTRDTE